MNPRLDYQQASPESIAAISSASEDVHAGFPDARLRALVELRVSQLNGCAYCIDLHSRQARTLGEDQQRLDLLPVWREVAFYSPRECAAFAWAEAVTLVAQTHVPDEVYQAVIPHFTEKELVQLTTIIGLMNVWNRMAISFRNGPSRRRGSA